MSTDLPFPVPPRDGDTHDLADQMRRAQECNAIADLLAARQDPRPGRRFMTVMGFTAAATLLSWGILGATVANHSEPRLGLRIVIPLALTAMLSLASIILAGVGVLIYVVNTRVAEWDRIAAWERARADEKMSALVERVTQLQRLVGLMSGMSGSPDKQQKWSDYAQLMKDDIARTNGSSGRNAPPDGVTPIVGGRPARNRSS